MRGAASKAKFGAGHRVLGKSQGRGPGTPLCLWLSGHPWVREITVPHFSHCETGALVIGACEERDAPRKTARRETNTPSVLRGSHCFPSKLLSASPLSCSTGCCCWISCLCLFLACERRNPTLELTVWSWGRHASVKDQRRVCGFRGPSGCSHSAAEQPMKYAQ